MTPIAWLLICLAAAMSSVNVAAIITDRRHLEYFVKPTVMVVLIAAGLLLHPASAAQRALFIGALAFGLAGDVLLMLPADRVMAGLIAFLVGHLFYIAGFRFGGFSMAGAVVGTAVVAVAALVLVGRVLSALESTGRHRLKIPVVAYVVVIGLMTISAAASGHLVAAAGGLLFFFSDAIFAWYRFVRPIGWGRPLNIALYQAGQALLVISLAT